MSSSCPTPPCYTNHYWPNSHLEDFVWVKWVFLVGLTWGHCNQVGLHEYCAVSASPIVTGSHQCTRSSYCTSMHWALVAPFQALNKKGPFLVYVLIIPQWISHTQGESVNGDSSAVNGVNGVSNGSGQDSGEESVADDIVGLYKVPEYTPFCNYVHICTFPPCKTTL